jgi:hypothetical protein
MNVDALAYENAVQAGDWPLAVKAGAGVRIMVMPDKFSKASARSRPFIQVSHQDGGHVGRAGINLGQDRPDLLPPPEAGEIEMHPDDA